MQDPRGLQCYPEALCLAADPGLHGILAKKEIADRSTMIIFMLLLTSGLGLSSCPAGQVAASRSWPQMLGFKKFSFFLDMSSRSFPGSAGPTGAHTRSGRKSSGYQLLKPLHTVTLNMRHMPNPQSSQKENPFCNEPRGPRRTKSIRSKKLYWPSPSSEPLPAMLTWS